MDLELMGRCALVTGGSRGIGRAVAFLLAHEGAHCAICGRNESTLRAAAEAISSETGRRVVPLVADVGDRAQALALGERAASVLGRLDIVINNAGRVSGGEPEDFLHLQDELVMRDVEEKYLGYLRVIRGSVPYLLAAGGGSIVNVAGLAARKAGSLSAGLRNAGVVHMTRTLARQLGPLGIRVNAVHPSMTETETLPDRIASIALRDNVSPDEVRRRMVAATAIGRLPTAIEVARVIVFLASTASAAITGETLAVSGGVGDAVIY